MSRHSEATLTAIKRSIDIVALVGDYLQLHRQGSKYKALCPFHDDHKPSLEVNPERQSFKCWSCGTGGDIFDFVREYERVDFPEALRMLAERAGIVMERATATAGGGPSKTELLAVLSWAKDVFRNAFHTMPEALEAREYASRRGIAGEIGARFELGYAPAGRGGLSECARKAGHPLALLEKAGLISGLDEDSARPKERFRGRLMFPIHDGRGRAVGFGGRSLPSHERKMEAEGLGIAKYINTPETALFQKRRLLYGAHLAREAARKLGTIAVVEGYTDVIAAHQAGVCNVVGTLGTALGDEHVQALVRLAPKAILVFDGDTAGQAAADRAIDIFLGNSADLRLLTLPDGLDPCDFLRDRGAEAFRDLLESAIDPLAHVIERSAARFDLSSFEQSRQAADLFLSTLLRVPRISTLGMDPRIGMALDRFSTKLRIPLSSLQARLGQLRREQDSAARNRTRFAAAKAQVPAPTESRFSDEPRAEPPPVRVIRASELDPIDREVVQIALLDPSLVGRVKARIIVSELRDPALRSILEACFDLYAEGIDPALEIVMSRLDDPAVRSLAAALVAPFDPSPLSKRAQPAPVEERLGKVLAKFAERRLKERERELKAALADIDRACDPHGYQELMNEYLTVLQQRPKTV